MNTYQQPVAALDCGLKDRPDGRGDEDHASTLYGAADPDMMVQQRHQNVRR
jgi:hypothetical protein